MGNEPQSDFEQPDWGKKNKSKSFWVQKTDDNLAHTWEVSQGRMKWFFSTVSSLKLRERTPEHFWETWLRKKKNHHKGCLGPEGQLKWSAYLVRLSRPNETILLYMLVLWSWGKRTPKKNWKTRLRAINTRSKFIWVQKTKGNKAHSWLDSQGPVKRLFSTWWCCEAE